MPASAGHLPTNFSKRPSCLPQERSELKALAFWIGVAVSRTKSTMQCPGFSSGVFPGKAGSLPKCNQYINTRFQYLLAFSLDPLAPCLILKFIIDMIYDQI